MSPRADLDAVVSRNGFVPHRHPPPLPTLRERNVGWRTLLVAVLKKLSVPAAFYLLRILLLTYLTYNLCLIHHRLNETFKSTCTLTYNKLTCVTVESFLKLNFVVEFIWKLLKLCFHKLYILSTLQYFCLIRYSTKFLSSVCLKFARSYTYYK